MSDGSVDMPDGWRIRPVLGGLTSQGQTATGHVTLDRDTQSRVEMSRR